MIIGPNYVFIAVPRTASMSFAAWLIGAFDGIWTGGHHDTRVPEEHQHKFTFAIARNPFTKLPSMHRYLSQVFWTSSRWMESEEAYNYRAIGMPMCQSLLTFIGWAATQRGFQWCPQAEMLDHVARLDAVLKYEELPDCVADLPFINGSSYPPLPHNGATHSRLPLTIRERDAIRIHSRIDFERYGYALA